ncbi:hypothetical protein PSEUDO8BK_40486 [Pseudomonas sp. 8BK]|nr:hypothetical protein PSEUDO8BK_40486 [Pseudomonas sp. 8BK]
MADPASATVYQDAITWFDRRCVDQAFPGSEQHQWHCRSLGHAQVLRLMRHQGGISEHIVGQRTLSAAYPAGATINRIAHGKTLHTRTYGADDASEVAMQNRREIMSEGGDVAAPQFIVQRIDGSCRNLDQQLASSGLRRWHFDFFEDVGGAEGIDHKGFHSVFSQVWVMKVSSRSLNRAGSSRCGQ